MFDVSGEFKRVIGRNGSEPGQFDVPVGLAIDRVGNLFVCDVGNKRVQALTPQGAFITEFGMEYQHTSPYGVLIDREGRILVGFSCGIVRVFGFTA